MVENNCDDENRKVKRIKLSEADNQNLSINDLPDECLLKIFSCFHLGELLQVEKVCQRWESLCEQLWKKITQFLLYFCDWTTDDIIWYDIADSKTDVNHIKKLLERCGKYITHFEISGTVTESAPSVTNLLAVVPKLCRNLTSMILYQEDEIFDYPMMQNLTRIKSLMDLSLTFSENNLPMKSINMLGNLVNLKKLYLSVEQLEDDNVIYISNNCKQLKALSISSSEKITDKGIVSTANLPKLESLGIAYLDYVTDDSIENLSSSLKRLWCIGCPDIKDDGVIKLIRKSSKLRYINLMDTPVTEALHQIVEEVNSMRSNCDQIEILMGKINDESYCSSELYISDDSDDADEDDYYYFP
ncbi:hypothetical protein PV325_000889 [Microctonus aethiopoides]|nr:hypothetical protein PV325_000889 [Microctonus aethiopoides]KAK0086388.1 hypothetical protein PV326_005579 [Microctonus aethiopoides]